MGDTGLMGETLQNKQRRGNDTLIHTYHAIDHQQIQTSARHNHILK